MFFRRARILVIRLMTTLKLISPSLLEVVNFCALLTPLRAILRVEVPETFQIGYHQLLRDFLIFT